MELPAFVNPAEFLIDIAAIDNRTPGLEAASAERVRQLKSHWEEESRVLFSADEEKVAYGEARSETNVSLSKHRSAFGRQVHVLTARTLKVTYRDPMGMTGSILEAIAMAVMTGWIFLNLASDQAGIRSREGALYSAAALQGYLILMYETYRLSIDIQLFDREHGEGVVGVVPFLISRRLARFFIEDLPVPLLYSLIFYWMCGFRADVAQFFTFFAIVILTHYIAISFATCCIAANRSFAGASVIANLGYTVQSMACGYFIQSQTIPVYVRWLKWTAYVFYAFGALCANEFAGHFYDCPLPGGESNPACAQYTGDYIMDSLGLPGDWIVRPIIVLLAFSIMFYVLAGIGFQFKPVSMSIAQARNSDTDFSAGKEKMTVRSAAEVRTVDIALNKFALDLEKRTIWGKKLPTKTILHPVTAKFQAGLLNVIMGPSGSGKTSLLNAMALRMHSTLGTKYRSSGEMTFNGAIPSDSVVRSVCSYVCQDDDALLPSLTVKETLRFAAGLRLPSRMSKEEKNRRAEDVLLKMGLKDCADNLIGSEFVKGISGGEKRRVTIAVQILTDPRVLLLDEPTSGLDAFTASSIMEVLQGLANEGRTLIFTIHQSRSDLFKHFGTVLLLARGGSPVYAGNGSGMLPHFDALGFPCPITTNPADFALDLITIDLQQSTKEKASREKVRSLITSWTSADFSTAPQAPSTLATPAQLGALIRAPAKFTTAFPILVHRATINLRRQPPLLVARTMQVIGLAIILTLFFAPLKNDYYSVQNRLGFIQEFCAFYFVGVLQNVAVYPAEKEVFYREHDDGAYGVEAFFLQYTLCEIPFEITTCIVFAALVDLGGGLPRTATMFWVCFFNCFCIVSCGESLGIMFNTLFHHTGFAINIMSVLLSISLTMSGILSINMPAFLSALNYLSPVRYAIRNLAPYSLRDIAFTCNESQRLPDGSCTISNGEDVLRLYNLDVKPGWEVLALGVCVLVYRAVAYLLLRFRRTRWEGFAGKSKGRALETLVR
jgi:ABC-type multidrug transport system ATPase subunit